MNTLISRTLTVASLAAAATAFGAVQGSPVVYPSFLPTANQVTATGQMNYEVKVPNNQDTCIQPINDSITMTSTTMLSASASTSCAVAAASPVSTGGEGCQYSGAADVVPLVSSSGTGFSFDVNGDTGGIQIVAKSEHVLTAVVNAVGQGPGPSMGQATSDFSIDDPAVISVPFAIAHDGSMALVYGGDAVLSRQAAGLSGSSEMSWRIVADSNRNGLIDPTETFTVLSGGTGAITGGLVSNPGLQSSIINRGLYVLELTLATEAGAEATAFCGDGPSSDFQAGAELVATRLNVDFL